MKRESRGYVTEPSKTIPVAQDVDVAVIGGGCAGIFAGLAAARMGVDTVLIDRFGSLGGNIGPGYLIGGGATAEKFVLGSRMPGIPEEFFRRAEEIGSVQGVKYSGISNTVSYLSFKMAEESGLKLILSAYAADPIMEGRKAAGIYIEGKSGRTAIKAKVLIDATGDASIAKRAGAGIINNVSRDYTSYGSLLENFKDDFDQYNECGLFMLIGNADSERYNRFLTENSDISDEDRAWAEENLKGPKVDVFSDAVIPFMRKAWNEDGFRIVKKLRDPDITISSNRKIGSYGRNIMGGRAAIAAGEIDTGDTGCISLLERELRIHAFETVQFLKKYVPGFEDAYLMFISPFMGARGGPCIEAEHVLTVEDAAGGRRFDDVLFKNYKRRENIWPDWSGSGYDVPYRMMIPRGIDNLLVIGRGAGYIRRGHDGAGMRTRPVQYALGQAAGTAAALCIRESSTVMGLDVKKLQKELLGEGFDIGDENRLRELGLR